MLGIVGLVGVWERELGTVDLLVIYWQMIRYKKNLKFGEIQVGWGKEHGTVDFLEEWENVLGTVDFLEEWARELGTVDLQVNH